MAMSGAAQSPSRVGELGGAWIWLRLDPSTQGGGRVLVGHHRDSSRSGVLRGGKLRHRRIRGAAPPWCPPLSQRSRRIGGGGAGRLLLACGGGCSPGANGGSRVRCCRRCMLGCYLHPDPPTAT
ncbi:hypothetical protein E2562_035179 [Oryza meyeriana var. granulata]|uniref:Uncharacterized protein n=1 Tax=Oryza meyeriana var. granulata TaxID=110450 RepID=A0A6G1CAV5_9ORYZ|nr:hypothetical protein E2562_035179 [Oryza meyeriana var. granulata]